MTEPAAPPPAHVKPFVREELATKSLHFNMGELQSRMQILAPDTLDLAYTRTMMGFLLFNAQPRHIVMIGLGGGSMAKFCHRHLSDTQLQVVEINPHVVALREVFRVPPDGPRFQVVLADGAEFVQIADSPCDVLLVDGFDGGGQPPALCTQRFYDDCERMLQPGGILVVNLHLGHPDHGVMVDRIGRSFDGAVLVVDDGELSNSVVFAFKGKAFPMGRAGILRRPKQLPNAAASQLAAAFALITAALQDQTDAE